MVDSSYSGVYFLFARPFATPLRVRRGHHLHRRLSRGWWEEQEQDQQCRHIEFMSFLEKLNFAQRPRMTEEDKEY